MTKLWCKLWNFFLNIFTSVVDGIGYALSTVGTVLVETLGAVLEAGGEVIGGLFGSTGGLMTLALLGFGAYLLLKPSDREGNGDATIVSPNPSIERG